MLVALGGFIGANARFIVASWFARRFSSVFPYGVLFINFSGSFLLALFLALTARTILADEAYRLLIAVGFCGGYTTFSTYTFDTLSLLRQKKYLRALLGNLLGSYVLGLLAALAGFGLGNYQF